MFIFSAHKEGQRNIIMRIISDIVLAAKKLIIAGCISLVLWLEDQPTPISRNVLAANTNQHPNTN